MVKLKPFTFTPQCPFSISECPTLPFPISKINANSSHRNANPIALSLSQSHPTPTILCARRRGWSQPSMLQLASTIAFNLKILPEPFHSLAGEIVGGDWKFETLVGGLGGKVTRNRRRKNKKLAWFVVLVCVAGLWSWRVRELELFPRVLSFCLAGISLVRLWFGKKAVKEWFLGFFFGIALVLSSRLGKEDIKFWVQKLMTFSPVIQIVNSNRNRSRNRNRRLLK